MKWIGVVFVVSAAAVRRYSTKLMGSQRSVEVTECVLALLYPRSERTSMPNIQKRTENAGVCVRVCACQCCVRASSESILHLLHSNSPCLCKGGVSHSPRPASVTHSLEPRRTKAGLIWIQCSTWCSKTAQFITGDIRSCGDEEKWQPLPHRSRLPMPLLPPLLSKTRWFTRQVFHVAAECQQLASFELQTFWFVLPFLFFW